MGNCLTHYYDNPEYWDDIMARSNYLTVYVEDCELNSIEFYNKLNNTLFNLCNKLNFKTYKYIDVVFKSQCIFQINKKNTNINIEFYWIRDFLTHNQYYNQIINKLK